MKQRPLSFILFIAFLLFQAAVVPSETEDTYALDNFFDLEKSRTRWEGITDQVMGGRSDLQTTFIREDDRFLLRMTGTVSLENNGGFIQVRFKLDEPDLPNPADYKGFYLEVRGTGNGYYLHAKTPRTFFPWSHFAAPLPVSDEWKRVKVPFSRFTSEFMMDSPFTPESIRSIAVVAAKQEMKANIRVREIGFYR